MKIFYNQVLKNWKIPWLFGKYKLKSVNKYFDREVRTPIMIKFEFKQNPLG